jgi:hypothetical protein
VSLSSLIDAALKEMTAEEAPTFSRRWTGTFEPAERGDPRYDALVKKYL